MKPFKITLASTIFSTNGEGFVSRMIGLCTLGDNLKTWRFWLAVLSSLEVSIVVNDSNYLEPDRNAGQPAVGF